ncbi:hypothetical protein [Kitasatospora sp. NPDC088346]|uniref:hypothetical protein n=1 Tax=Kitasatospora sp. NPDC088346 TaxID=3364073 RepID=UPI00381A2DD7
MAGILTNTGAAHELTNAFTVFGHHMTGSTGTPFLFGIIVGAAGMLGLALLLTGARRTSRRNAEARHGLRDSRREAEAVAKDRDDLAEQRDTTTGAAAGTLPPVGRTPAGPRPAVTRPQGGESLGDDPAVQRQPARRSRATGTPSGPPVRPDPGRRR